MFFCLYKFLMYLSWTGHSKRDGERESKWMVGIPNGQWMFVCLRGWERAEAAEVGSEKRTFAWALAHSPVVFIVKMARRKNPPLIFFAHYNSMVPPDKVTEKNTPSLMLFTLALTWSIKALELGHLRFGRYLFYL